MAKQDPWPKPAESPAAYTLTPDGYFRSDRPLAGPLRLGTAPGVGPKGLSRNTGFGSDMGTDRTTPMRFDPMGTSDTRSAAREKSTRVSQESRRKPFQKRSDGEDE